MSPDPTLVALGLPRLKIENERATSRLEHASNFSESFLNLLKWWLDAEMPYSPEQLDEMFQQLALPSVWNSRRELEMKQSLRCSKSGEW